MVDINQIVEIEPLTQKEYQPLFSKLQGNIVKSHGRENAVHFFLKFKSDVQAAKEWLGGFTRRHVTSALAQSYEAKWYRDTNQIGTPFANVFLSRFGYQNLGLITPANAPFQDNYFLDTMKGPLSQKGFLDPESRTWEQGFQQDIDALILIADDDVDNLRKLISEEHAACALVAEIVNIEHGFVLRNDKNQVIEHFGFRDGVSQPLFLKRDIEKERKCNPANFSEWDPSAPLSLVLLEDPFGGEEDCYGSYLVYRKLEQNVQGWVDDVVNKLAPALGIDPNLAGAYTMGRFQDGTPVVLRETPIGGIDPATNNFNFKDDSTGSKCPFHSHIRKTNPRGDTGDILGLVPLEEEKMHRITRRAISYGESDPNQQPETGSGLLFLCFQGNIANQFAFMQSNWANQAAFIKPETGSDPVVGQGPTLTESYKNWPATWGETERKTADFSHWVSMKGGEYFFTPSIPFLESLNAASVRVVQLVSKLSNKLIDVAGGSMDDGADIIQWPSNGGDNQKWLLEDAGNGYFFIRSKKSGKVLDVTGGSIENCAKIIQFTKHGGDNQLWRFEDCGNGYFYVVSKKSGKVLDITGANPEDGTPIIQYEKKAENTDNQLWMLQDV